MNKLTALLSSVVIASIPLMTYGQTFTYTNSDTGSDKIPLGYAVPIPVDSMTPIAGFRTYESLDLRHRQLHLASDHINQTEIGRTFHDRPIYAYTLSDSDGLTSEGFREASALINGGIHAREWQTPEAVTGYMEYLFDNQADQHLAQYLLENLNFVVIPVLNIDGFLQTQRFPDTVTNSSSTPRDGRMRRKNMRGVDERLDTTGDNLQGIDLNRNNAPFWATSNRSSSDTSSLVHHGASPGSEPETQALQAAVQLAGQARLRFYIDTHSFSQIYFAPYTQNTRRNEINDNIADIMRAANDFQYDYGPSGSGAGIGSTDEYFANTYNVVSYTLEIEPNSSGAQYGGTGVSHSGFILPNAQVPRMRNETRKATMAGLYAMSMPPSIIGIKVIDATNERTVFEGQWQNQSEQRQFVRSIENALESQTDYVMHLQFNKPMRQIEQGNVVGFSNITNPIGVTLQLVGQRNAQDVVYDIDSSAGHWLIESGFSRYKTDTFSVPFSLPNDFVWSEHSLLAASVSTQDFTGQQLDSDPTTVADWQDGHWVNYEDALGNDNSDTGGPSQASRLIDDDSPLFASMTPDPDPVPLPTPPASNSSGGGAGLGGFLGILLLAGLSRRWFARDDNPV